MDRVTVSIDRDGGQERHLVLRAAPSGAAAELAAEVGVVHLDLAAEEVACLALEHRLHELVLDQPSGGVADPQVAFERQGRQAGFHLADEIDGQVPHPQGQLGAPKDRPSDQGGLLSAAPALEDLARPDPQHVVAALPAMRTAQPLRPAQLLERRLALVANWRRNAGKDRPASS